VARKRPPALACPSGLAFNDVILIERRLEGHNFFDILKLIRVKPSIVFSVIVRT